MSIELFLDAYRISWEDNVRRMLCPPIKHEENPILTPEHPWEEAYVTIYGNVLANDDTGGYRMWYQAEPRGGRREQVLCLAESEDGYHWQRVMSKDHPLGGCGQTNIVLGPDPNVHGPCVLRNCHNDNPEERYLLFYDSYPDSRPHMKDVLQASRWCYTATSPDGVCWQPRHGRPAVPGKSDVGQSVIWDAKHRRYIAYLRGVRPHAELRPFDGPSGETMRVRYVRGAASPDFLHWSDPVELLRADARDGDPCVHIHQFSVTPRGDQFIGLLSLFQVDECFETPLEGHGKAVIEEGTCQTQLAVSRDGLRWDRVADRQIFLPRGSAGQWDSQWIVTAGNILFDDRNDRMLFYYGAADRKRSQGHCYRIGAATLPRDRFQAIRPAHLHRPAVLETKPLYLHEGDLRINADAARGRITVELCDFNGNGIEGFGRAESTAVGTDGLDHLIRWNGKRLSDARRVDRLFQKAIRIRFYLDQASLYAAYFPDEARESIIHAID